MDLELRDALLAYTDSHTASDGIYATGVPGLALLRSDRRTPLQHKLYYERAFIVVVQGAKQLMIGTRRVTYRAGNYMIMSVAMPVRASITQATRARPYLSIAMEIDRRAIAELLDTVPSPGGTPAESPPLGVFVGTPDERQRAALRRLVPLFADDDALRALYPTVMRELLYWSLRGRDAAEMRRLAAPEGHAQRIADAIAAMRAAFPRPVPTDTLACIAHMSPSSFHQHFKATTGRSPLQFQKQLRLLEARRLMLAGSDATRAAYSVGYESLSQFTREYARMFGAPPRREISVALAGFA